MRMLGCFFCPCLYIPLTIKAYESDEYGNVDNDPAELASA